MKNNKIRIALVFLLILTKFSCQRDQPIDPNYGYKVFNVHVQKAYNNQVPNSYNLVFSKTTWRSSGSFIDSSMYYTTTDARGNATFKVPDTKIENSAVIFYYIGSGKSNVDTIPDSTRDTWKYFGEEEVYHYGEAHYNRTIAIYPSCEIVLYTYQEDWESKNIDSLIVELPTNQYGGRFIMGRDEFWENPAGVYLEAFCCENNKISYYYYSNGVKSMVYNKEFYAPFNSRLPGEEAKLTLKF